MCRGWGDRHALKGGAGVTSRGRRIVWLVRPGRAARSRPGHGAVAGQAPTGGQSCATGAVAPLAIGKQRSQAGLELFPDLIR